MPPTAKESRVYHALVAESRMVICHLGHGLHGGHDGQGRREDERGKGDSSPGGGHQH